MGTNRKMEWLESRIYGVIMATIRSWADYNSMNEKQLREEIRKLGAVANKRLKRMESKGINYSTYTGEDSISGVRKFRVGNINKGDIGMLRSELKRVIGFLKAKTGSLSGMKEVYHEHKSREARQRGEVEPSRKMTDRDFYNDSNWATHFRIYNAAVSMGLIAQLSYDSNQGLQWAYEQAEKAGTELTKDEAIDYVSREYEKLFPTERNSPQDTSSLV